ncbi:GNAT family N-acetyltransferase [Actinoplanes flavus]|uniref:GNAT family N-acetyltransferase n=1 Tax=Actinoplanes flavus TaxID=2820290 RepID=A0ABS3UD39_9ACTN|nr:GNAT family N-acetyltransferase [Actinoplanes flavus]MBO3736692.1 GNAT family N-acetyltransferase [Actinoplanes flavus]
MTHPYITIRRAEPDDVALVTGLLAAAFQSGEFGPWLIPDPRHRALAYPGYFRIFAEHAVEHGHVHVIDQDAVALWYAVDNEFGIVIDDYVQRLRQAVGPALHRFLALDQAMHHHHPTGQPHDYLAFLAVHPSRQRRGLGAALLTHHHAGLDDEGRPAFLEATGPATRRVYERFGFEALVPYQVTPDSPQLHPMWRPAGASRARVT